MKEKHLLKQIENHLQEFGLNFCSEEEYWVWGGRQLENNVPKKELKKFLNLQDKMSENPKYTEKKKFYDLIASNNTLIKVTHSMKSFEISNSCNHIITEIKDASNILDLGCNVGYLSSFYAKNFTKSRVIGFDRCKKSIIKARKFFNNIQNLQFVNNTNNIADLEFDYIVDTQCLSDIADENIISNLLCKLYKILNSDGSIISISALPNEDDANVLFNIFTKNNFYLNKLETVTFKGISGYQGYTKTIFNKFNTNYKYNLEKYFLQLRRKISRLSC